MARSTTNAPIMRQFHISLIVNLENYGFLDLKPHRFYNTHRKKHVLRALRRSNVLGFRHGECHTLLRVTARVTENVTLFCVLLRVWMGDPVKKVKVPLTLLRVSVSFAKSESDLPVITNS